MDQSWTVKSLAALAFVQLFAVVVECSFDPFMDSKLYTIKWQGPLDLNREEMDVLGDRHVLITTNHQENYQCILPEILKLSENDALSYTGPTADELMKPLFHQTHCSYRIESYWTYELCHGKHLKQYHETKEQGLVAKVQEYFLGFGNIDNLKEAASTPPESKTSSLPVRVVDGVELPFYEVIMGEGTKCDLTGKPRKAHILYVCHQEGWGEVYELKESSTCEYEVIVLSSYLCNHPKYRPKTTPVNEIRCHAMTGSPLKPMEMSQAEIETRYLQDANQGAGWWKHELCFGSFVKQSHNEQGKDANIYLGYWNKEKHIIWLHDNPLKRPHPANERKQISLFYSDGDVCDLTGKPRNCEVRLKCLQNSKNPHAMVLSLAEPESCQYLLTVESVLFCPILKDADDNGLFGPIEV